MQHNASEPGQAASMSRNRYPGTYIIHEVASEQEARRHVLSHRLLKEATGGLLPEQPPTAQFKYILDVGCGSGDWLIEMAREHPECTRLIGVDANSQVIDYANRQAAEQHLGERVEFQIMDVLSTLDFPLISFDLINMRSGSTFLRTWEWSNLLNRFHSILRPSGMVRISELDTIVRSSSSALTNLLTLVNQALNYAGHLFTEEQVNVTTELPDLLTSTRFEQVQTHTVQLKFLPGTQQARDFNEFLGITLRSLQPFLRKWLRLPEDFEDLYQQALDELRLPDFTAETSLVTVRAIATR